VGPSIRSLRIARGLIQEALALESGVTRNVPINGNTAGAALLYERLFDIAEALLPIAEFAMCIPNCNVYLDSLRGDRPVLLCEPQPARGVRRNLQLDETRPIVVFHAMRRSGSNSMTVLSPASGSCPH
jgi:hypothetical protein